jgi:hypothetical protein
MSESSELPAGTVVSPPLCQWHQHDLVVHRLKIPESGPWVVAFVTMQILLFTWVTSDVRVYRRTRGELADMSLVLAELGCLACYDGEGYDRATILLRRDASLAAKVAQGKATDPDWPIQARFDAVAADKT